MKIYVVMRIHYEYVFGGEGYYSSSIDSVFSTKEKAEERVSLLRPKDKKPCSSWYDIEEYEVAA